MRIFISGGCKNGKSSLACRLANQLAKGAPVYYVATFIPRDEEDQARIRYHVRRRKGLGFQTIEWSRSIDRCRIPKKGSTVLLDSVTALVQNESFTEDGIFTPCHERVARELLEFAQYADNVIFISDYIYSDAGCYDELTKAYSRSLAYVDRTLAAACDTVVELCAANAQVHKGQLPQYLDHLLGHGPRELIIGGANQGKKSYAMARYGLSPRDFFRCRDDAPLDPEARVLCDLENYVRYCLRHDLPMQTTFPPDTILLCRDLFCGVVPIDPEQRRWREETGHYLAKLAAKSTHVTRIFAGIPQSIK